MKITRMSALIILILRLSLVSLGIEQLLQLIKYSITHQNITMKPKILTILFVMALAKSATPLNCYQCSLDPETGEGSCSDTQYGESIDCSQVDKSNQLGDLSCVIRQAKGGVTAYERTCVRVLPESLGCTETGMEGKEEHTCYCKTDLCNKDWNSAGDSTTPSSSSAAPTTSNEGQTLSCYQCSLDPETGAGSCDDTHYGESIDCSQVDTSDQLGDLSCVIRQAKGGVTAYERTCVKMLPESLGCTETGMEGEEEHTCYCKTDLCNENWVTAGDSTTTTTSAALTTSNDGKTLSCYQCSLDPETGAGSCDDTHYGESIDCSQVDTSDQLGDISCIIRQAKGGVTAYERTCVRVLPESLGCTETGIEGEEEHTCYCKTDLCNKDWNSAGESTTTENTPVDYTTTTSATTTSGAEALLLHSGVLIALIVIFQGIS